MASSLATSMCLREVFGLSREVVCLRLPSTRKSSLIKSKSAEDLACIGYLFTGWRMVLVICCILVV
jgi:hypothetical protein